MPVAVIKVLCEKVILKKFIKGMENPSPNIDITWIFVAFVG